MRRLLLLLILASPILAAGCDTGPNGYGTAPPGTSQAAWDAQKAAERDAYRDYMHGPRGGSR
ncbi:hypothetical protein R5H30_08380 [Sulfitobacter sp. D35]|uniref:hypothetical protein n=1 Tax=Sulfitobacter sp. D35 TaxID=3083252 RepID=UPI00296EB75D|nr:hypothetical protein [Sulfitobacter sp. D35]MDW4497991.1 hypothetical protein [Sulfitobacter sp. D35]